MKKIVLFDMDGTLTEPRGQMRYTMVDSLKKLHTHGYEIGIVTGSDLNYLQEQCEILFTNSSIDATKIHFLPCNGTKYYRFTSKWDLISGVDMIEKIGKEAYRQLLISCGSWQQKILNTYSDIEYTGNFFDYRGSVLNWCPIGRSSTKTHRAIFIKADKKTSLRNNLLKHLRDESKTNGFDSVTIALGGESSFDIYPSGWDKTFALQYFEGYDISFVGDRCTKDGNDYTLYKKCQNKGYITDGPATTLKIINKIINEK
jgi:phosphomannomutase